MNRVSVKLRAAMQGKGIAPDKIDRIIQAITSFALYGFPESHAISFAILAYASAYLKVHRAPEFFASLINNQPMGFYTPATIVKDAQRHGVKVKPVCVKRSDWRCTVLDDTTFRLGFCVVNGLRQEHGEQIERERNERQFKSLEDFKRRIAVSKEELRTLAELGAFNGFSKHRRAAMWKVEEPLHDDLLGSTSVPAAFVSNASATTPLLPMTVQERVTADYRTMSLTAGPHPMKLLREHLPNIWRASDLSKAKHGSTIQIAGNVICRQRPGTAKGFVFVSLEDETGVSNAIVDPDLFEKYRLLITEEDFLLIEGEVQNSENVVLIKTHIIKPLAHENFIGSESHDFR